ncbi:hypothetical protein GCM10009715_24810 [Paeniglutamicibacter psychrophenolicus]|uniref:Outer membrane protein assembly factor BamB n=1 Tax=Paeniglutamicibacter psychrophenolicus TaxID=257454 RepID=A0ABS4WDZ9_9MICC|nr:hypothetical protein [Paeniglutamicibacter psychrophenolicus]MBP2374435.1 outer membrane protein assembly factor BamB [Paeniglutamicibacter psychrophenolicus]
MSGLTGAPVPWLAVSIVGPSNQLQIVNPDAGVPVHVLSIAGIHSGGIDSMVWHRESKTLYFAFGASLQSWSPANPNVVSHIGRVPGASTLYDLQFDSAGNIWGGAYPNGATFTYVASAKQIRTHSRLASDTDYITSLAIDNIDQVWVGTGAQNPRLFTFPTSHPARRTEIQLPDPIPSGFITSIDAIGDRVVVTANGVRSELLLDRATKKWAGKVDRVWSSRRTSAAVTSPEMLNSGTFYTLTEKFLYATNTTTWKESKLGGVRTSAPLTIQASETTVLVVGQTPTGLRLESFHLASGRVEQTRAVTLREGELTIQSLMGHSDGNIYIGGYMGDGIAAINPDTGLRWKSPDDQGIINQVEGMIEFDAKQSYIGSYGFADIVGMTHGRKESSDGYHRLGRLSHQYHQSRPFGWAVNSRNVFFGTVPDYGRAGGVLGMIDPNARTIPWVLDGGGAGFVHAQSIVGLAADDRYVYGTSSVRNGYGLPDTKGPAKAFKLEIATKQKIWETAPVPGAGALYAPVLIAGWLVVADIEGIHIIDPSTGKHVHRHRLTPARNETYRPGWANAGLALAGDGSKLVHSASGTTTVIDFRAGTRSIIGSPQSKESFGAHMATSPAGRVFGYTDKTVLVELDLTPRTTPLAAQFPRP